MPDQPPRIADKDVERVGVILVHGIGEQRRFEHLEGETRKISNAIIANYGKPRRLVTPTLTTSIGDTFLGEQQSWASGNAALHALVELPDKIVDIAFHEVWWADINEVLTLSKQFRFWLWGLSLAGIATHNDQYLLGAIKRTRPPRHHGAIRTKSRIRMLYISILFGFSAFSVALVNMIFKRLGLPPLPLTATIVNYLSAVKLYSQDTRAGGSPMDGPDEPPRAAIRRRMIRVMVNVAMGGYDRWYILAHSLGTIVAWNGLMEIQQALPNYLDRECWEELKGNPLRTTIMDPFDVDSMMPNRPVWVRANEIINRDVLFEKFCGLLTYGSPLERFCALWSAMIPLNKTEDTFQAGTEWINVYDPTDPVGTWLEDFNPHHTPPPRDGRTALTPRNFRCRASRWLLVSHISYFNAARRETNDSKHYLVNVVAKWLVEGGSLAEKIDHAHKGNKTFWIRHGQNEYQTRRFVVVRRNWRVIQAAIVGLILTLLTLLSLEYVVLPLLKTAKGVLSPFVKTLLGSLKLSILIPWMSAFLKLSKNGLSTSFYCLSQTWGFLADHFHLWTWIPKFVIESIVLWVAMFLVVIGACLIHYRASKSERDRLHARFASQTKHTSR
jgi:hypothetical protein